MILPTSSNSSLGEIYILFVKGYLRYKTITFQKVPSEAQIKMFFILWKNMFRSRDIQVFVFSTIRCYTKSVTYDKY